MNNDHITIMKSILQLMRPLQWMKNMFVFLPLFFDRHLFDVPQLIPALVIFVAFCFAASGIYCFNDIHDVESDKRHPLKSKRPIASGAVTKQFAYLVMAICIVASFSTIGVYQWRVGHGPVWLSCIIAFYVLMNIGYCIRLKHIAIVDVFVIAMGFVLRVLAGGFATGIYISHWIILMTFLLALFLAFAKRRDDVVMYEDTGVKMRSNVNRYNLDFMNQLITVVGCLTMMCYIMYTVSPEVIARFQCSYVYITSVFVLAGIIRYLQLSMVDVRSGSPTRILVKDRFVQFCILGWMVAFVVIIYL